jgi:putative ABC transport system permease protein
MRFVFRMAARETRAAWRRLLFFFLCIAIGVGAIAALRSAIQNVRGVLTGQARTLLAADLLVTSGQPLAGEVRRTIDQRLAAHGCARTERHRDSDDGRPADVTRRRMAERRAVQPGPFTGASSYPA